MSRKIYMPRKAKILTGIALAILAVLLTASACAEYPVDPSLEEMYAFKREELRNTRPFLTFQAAADGVRDDGYSSGVSISVSGTKAPTKTLAFRAAVAGDVKPDECEFKWGISDEDRDPSGYIYWPQHETDNLTGKDTIRYTFYSAGTYRAYVHVSLNGEQIGWGYEDFIIADDGVHPTLEEKAREIVNECKGQTDWDTALNLYDWMTHHCYYDGSYNHHGADILFLGYGVCDSYSKAYMLLLRTAGIPAERTLAPNHAWNTLRLDGEWYQADATWDDTGNALPGEGQAESGNEGHQFFCLSAEAMKPVASHHYADGSQEGEHAAECTSMEANYYIHTGLWRTFSTREFDYDAWEYRFIPYTDQIQAVFDAGGTVFEQTVTRSLYVEEEYTWFSYDSIFRAVMSAGLAKGTYRIGEDGIRIRVSVSEDLELKAGLSGWDIEETGTLEIPQSVERIGAEAFAGNAATTVEIPEGCVEIESGAFADSAARSVSIPSTVARIADDAFDGCGKIILVTANETAIGYAEEHGLLVAEP